MLCRVGVVSGPLGVSVYTVLSIVMFNDLSRRISGD